MKKGVLCLIVCFLCVGCGNSKIAEEEPTADSQYKEYKAYVDTLLETSTFEEACDEFNVQVVTNVTNKDNYRYDVIINEPTMDMFNIKVIASIPVEEGDTYPSLGLLESGVFTMKPDVVDTANNVYKGINLSGISPFSEVTILVYITFTKTEDSKEVEERFIKVQVDATG